MSQNILELLAEKKYSAVKQQIANFEEVEDDATRYLEEMAKRKEHLDVLFMDPPRKGSTSAFLAAAKALQPKRIVYVSCGPSSLARDVKSLLDTYQIDKVQPVDLFPRTEHVETVCLLTKK